MGSRFRARSLLPDGLIVEDVEHTGDMLVAVARSPSRTSSCPVCGRASTQVHSRYERCLSDLPAHGRRVRLRLQVRRFRCPDDACPRRIFAERLDEGVAQPWARRSARLQEIVHYVALMLGGRPGQNLTQRLLLPVSNDTLLRAVRRRGTPRAVPPTVIGIDDWAWRRNQRYGTIVCDLERRKTIALLPDREPATAEAWLQGQQQIAIVARDRGGGYGLAITKALPQATQVADRWHLMENASGAFLDAVRKSMRQIRGAIGAATINPELLTAAERLQYEGYLRREETDAAILELASKGIAIKEIVRRTGHSRGLVRRVLRGQRFDVFRVRESSLELHLPWLEEQWAAGQRNGAALWRQLKSQGFRGSLRVVTEWATRRRRAEQADSGLTRTPSSRTIARLMTVARDRLSRAETVTVATIESGVPLLVEAREIIAAFHVMIRMRSLADLSPWLERARTSLVASFANGVMKDQAAVAAAITSGWSNGQTEGQITKLKLVKRQMYGRGKLDLLQARVVGPA
jgi:transposase